jgi:hypothetical protein
MNSNIMMMKSGSLIFNPDHIIIMLLFITSSNTVHLVMNSKIIMLLLITSSNTVHLVMNSNIISWNENYLHAAKKIWIFRYPTVV